MLLALDIGNTVLTFGVFEGEDEPRGVCTPSATWKVATDPIKMSDEYGLLVINLLGLKNISPGDIDAVVLCNVVPPLTQAFIELSKSYFSLTPLVIGSGLKTGVRVLYDAVQAGWCGGWIAAVVDWGQTGVGCHCGG